MEGKRETAYAQQDFLVPQAPGPKQGSPAEYLVYLFVRRSHVPHLATSFPMTGHSFHAAISMAGKQ